MTTGGNLPELLRAAQEAEQVSAQRAKMYIGGANSTPGFVPLDGGMAFAMGLAVDKNPYDYVSQPYEFNKWTTAWHNTKTVFKVEMPEPELNEKEPEELSFVDLTLLGKSEEKEELIKFKSGATRSSVDYDLTLIPRSALIALGRRLLIGKGKHGKNNWRKSVKAKDEDWREATITHLLDHIFKYLEEGNANDKNTDAIICNAAFLCEFEAAHPYKGLGQTE